jgi:hypothetical protein
MNVFDRIEERFKSANSIPVERTHITVEEWREVGRIVSDLLNHCPDAECHDCGALMCPHGEPLHFHHDGCPACCGGKP